ncbi:TonB-dependent siderophore receptor [Mesorhizobium sp. M7A.F.Ca.CA.001.07.2.1]|uniref:TonB-dependent siderophore receptor n=1 Tax=Mesorhizobium TaxID=68287 RepID=UPI000FCA0771|nr:MULTISPECIES: TonB-dependent siderophore receptor [Mesorhizobium]RVB37782.1 TonB-dependent siderophore receptor [Mesorhizobium sp. M7A.F.Ca.CA.004.05.1.1]MCF6123312.1 TonB-dependent siderophore receptor [Mesorhizobium ciceri]MCQ8815264.1 TonB-dependent siderophore receptor [Mesorhizobium sp. SEMIA396]RUX81089.1 TonB-dependent siderophore receptor [Mesorhizobium sp. M7A.F.Ca.CA.004.08.2.1]RUX83278.1 TonB-dependent siderophore receptor [Mesorhizobium sp. M7A.F.Ca.CA.004.08.1.1]
MTIGRQALPRTQVRRLIASSALIAASFGAVGAGRAQEVSPDDATQLETIVVTGKSDRLVGPDQTIVAEDTATATKTDTPIVDVPASVSVVTQKELEARHVESLQQAVAYTSSVLTDEFGNDDRYDYIRIRGFDQTSLGTYRDGLTARIPAWFTASRLEPYGLQRVEVLKGSTSTLFGLNGPGGLVNAITKRPLDQKQGEIYTSYGDGTKEVGVDFGGPIDPDGVWTYRLTGLAKDGDQGWDYSNDDRLYIAPALTIKPEEGTSLTILTDYYKRDGTGARGTPAGGNIDIGTFLGEPDFNRFNTEQVDIGYQFEHEFNENLTLRSNARYTHLSLDYAEVYGASLDPTADRTAFSVDGLSNRYAFDNQLQYDTGWGGIDSKTLVGVDYANDNTRENILFGTAGPIDIDNPAYCGLSCINLGPYVNWRVKQQAVGVYAQEQLTFDDRWIVTLGGRWDRVHTTADYLDSGTQDDDTASAFTKRAGLTYKFTPNLAVYANYSESFQPLVAPSGNGYAVSGSLKPQEGRQYEAGIKYKPDGFDGLFTAAVFDLTQTNVPTYVTPVVQQQIGKVGVRGIELEGKAAIAENLNLTLAYSYWDAEILEDGIGGNAGNRPQRVPRHLASAWVDYTLPEEGRRGDLTIGGGVRYIGQTYGDDANTTSIGGYALVDAAISYKMTKDVTLALNATNLFDRKYLTTSYYGTEFYGDRLKIVGTLKHSW